ncbi:NfeD family protein [Catenovulum maritimum]|uniref:Activity regulator of membrane protease YbbK n=1 Tax=Catenovulum maritimum TaxID=1513271 RepID=A0A0J8GYX0_9ALTE|nr:activity regulator of membrane protease YbbK [Catenovulum maritimum]
MIDLISNHLAESLIALGILFLTIEVVILGFSTFILFFLGLSLVLTGSAIWIGLLPETLASILLSNAIITTLMTFLLWQPLKNMQNRTEKKEVKSDFVGVKFFVDQEVNLEGNCQHKYSGITWKVKSQTPISAGNEVEVIKAEVGTLWVQTVNQA